MDLLVPLGKKEIHVNEALVRRTMYTDSRSEW
jgi:hypothetical protein